MKRCSLQKMYRSSVIDAWRYSLFFSLHLPRQPLRQFIRNFWCYDGIA